MSLSYYGCCSLCCRYSEKKTSAVLLFSLITYFVIPREIYMQSVVWTSGFANYVPPALMSLAYLCIVKNIAGDETPEYKKFTWIITFVLGFSAALFMENITLFNICLAVAVIGYALIRFRKVFAAHIGFLVGAVGGAVWMFTNGAYLAISKGDDGYRNTADSVSGLFETIEDHLFISLDNILFNNYILCIIASVLLFALVLGFVRNARKSQVGVAIAALALNIISVVFVVLKGTVKEEGMFAFLQSKKACLAIAAVYALSMVVVSFVCIEKGRRFKTMLPLYCVPVVVAPLLVVNPIGPRCYFVAYLFMMAYLADVFAYVIEKNSISGKKLVALVCAGCVIFILQAGIYLSIFAPIHACDTKRNEFAKLQSDNGEKTVYICELPNQEYLWTSSPKWEPWIERYKLFYGLNKKVKFTFVSEEELDVMISEYQNNE